MGVQIMLGQLGINIVGFADNIMVGHLGTVEFAGVAFANSIFVIGMVFCVCFTHLKYRSNILMVVFLS